MARQVWWCSPTWSNCKKLLSIGIIETPTRPSIRFLLPPSPESPHTANEDSHHGYLYPPVLTPPRQPFRWEDDDRPSKRRRTDETDTDNVFTATEQFSDIADLSWLEREDNLIRDPDVYVQPTSLDHSVEHALGLEATNDQPNGPKSYEDQALESILVDLDDPTTGATGESDFCAKESDHDEVCFGMVSAFCSPLGAKLRPSPQVGPIPLTLNPAFSPVLPHASVKIYVLDCVRINHDGSLFLIHDLSNVGQLDPRIASMLWEIQKESSISIQIRCTFTRGVTRRSTKKTDVPCSEPHATLSAIIYGPLSLFYDVGDFFENCDICLQDPSGGCSRNVRYRNPHKLSGLDEDAPMTIDRQPTVSYGSYAEESGRCYLDDLNFPQDLPEAPVPAAVRTVLYKHQLQGLYFMQTRERGWCLDGRLKDIWKSTQVCGLSMYSNTITDDVQQEPPKAFRGGFLFDDMGVGKTLTTIALIASDVDSARCNLVIVPPQLLRMWEEQLDEHLIPGKVRWYKHHSSRRISQLVQIAQYNVILTTYNTVANELKVRRSNSILFQARWHRIILDEAQEIRDPHTLAARAVCALKADIRWAITGTPIQNHLTDFRALLQFLRAYPYDDPAVFARDVTSVWQTDSETALRRLMRIITSLGLRRSKKCLQLPERVHQDTFLQFSPEEFALYEPLESHVSKIISHCNHLSGRSVQHNALKGLNALRLICNFGTLLDEKHLKVYDSPNGDWSYAEAQELFDGLMTTGNTTCCECSIGITSLRESDVGGSNTPDFDVLTREPAISECAKYLCGNCNLEAQYMEGLYTGWCGHNPSCATQTIKASCTPIAMNTPPIEELEFCDFPTKIKALIEDLRSHSNAKSVVFSAWKKTLDLCDRALALASISCVRFDGQINEPIRTDALARFRSDPGIQVILFTISCGAVGLDLTAANRAYLMEPQWNPTVEDQAFARIHRMRQKRPVTTVRFLMKDSYEEQVIDVQKQKRNFADLLLAGKRGKGFKGRYSEMSMAYETVKRLVGRR